MRPAEEGRSTPRAEAGTESGSGRAGKGWVERPGTAGKDGVEGPGQQRRRRCIGPGCMWDAAAAVVVREGRLLMRGGA